MFLIPPPEQKMFRDRTEAMLFRAGTVSETVPVRSLTNTIIHSKLLLSVTHTELFTFVQLAIACMLFHVCHQRCDAFQKHQHKPW